MPERSERIEIRVTPERKEEIYDWVGETEAYPSVARMFRALATERMHDDADKDDAAGSIDEDTLRRAVAEAVAPIDDRLDRIEHAIADIDTGVQEDIEDLMHDIVAELPVVDDSDELPGMYEIMQRQDNGKFSTPIEYAQATSTAGAWAGYVDADVDRVRRALVRAVDSFPDVKYDISNPDDERYDVSDERRYYRVA